MAVEQLIKHIQVQKDSETAEIEKRLEELEQKSVTNEEWFKVVCAAAANRNTIYLAARLIKDTETIKAKFKPKPINESGATLYSILAIKPDFSGIDGQQLQDLLTSYTDFSYELYCKIKDWQPGRKAAPVVTGILMSLFADYNFYHTAIIEECVDLCDWTGVDTKQKEEFLDNVYKFVLAHPDSDWYMLEEQLHFIRLIPFVWGKLFAEIRLDNAHTRCIDKLLTILLHTFYKVEHLTSMDQWTLGGILSYEIIKDFLDRNSTKPTTDGHLDPFVQPAVDMVKHIDEGKLFNAYTETENNSLRSFLAQMIRSKPKLAGPQIYQHCQIAFKHKQIAYFTALNEIYARLKSDEQKVMNGLAQEFVDYIVENYTESEQIGGTVQICLEILSKMVTNQVDLTFAAPKLEPLLLGSGQFAPNTVKLFIELERRFSGCFVGKGDQWFQQSDFLQNHTEFFFINLYTAIGKHSQAEAERVTKIVEQLLVKDSTPAEVSLFYLQMLDGFVTAYPDLVESRRNRIEQLAQVPMTLKLAESLLQTLDGLSLTNIHSRINRNEDQIGQLDVRVSDVEGRSQNLHSQVSKQTADISQNRADIERGHGDLGATATRVNVVEEDINILKRRVDRKNLKGTDLGLLLILCSFESQIGMNSLATKLKDQGYNCDIVRVDSTSSSQKLSNYDAIICAVTKKFYQSQQARKKLSEADSCRRPLIPLMFEKLQWSYISQTVPSLARFIPIDCLYADSRTWECDEFRQICDKLQRYEGSAKVAPIQSNSQKPPKAQLPRAPSTGSHVSSRSSSRGHADYQSGGRKSPVRQPNSELPLLTSVYRQNRQN